MFERFWRSGLAAALVFLLANCVMASRPATTQTDLVRAYVEAYNVRDLQAMAARMHPEIEWLSIEGSRAEIYASGKDDLTQQMREYLATSDTISEIDNLVINGAFVSVRETARWIAADGTPKAQSSLAVYEFEDDLIRRVWYFPATR